MKKSVTVGNNNLLKIKEVRKLAKNNKKIEKYSNNKKIIAIQNKVSIYSFSFLINKYILKKSANIYKIFNNKNYIDFSLYRWYHWTSRGEAAAHIPKEAIKWKRHLLLFLSFRWRSRCAPAAETPLDADGIAAAVETWKSAATEDALSLFSECMDLVASSCESLSRDNAQELLDESGSTNCAYPWSDAAFAAAQSVFSAAGVR